MKTFQKKGMNLKRSISPTRFPSLAGPSRPFAAVPVPISEQEPRVPEAQLDHTSPAGYSIATLPLFPPMLPSSGQSASVQRTLTSDNGNTHAIPLSMVFPLQQKRSTKASLVERISQEAEPLQRETEPLQNEKNDTGLPGRLKAGIETLSGLSMNDVHVHYNSSKPSHVQALAYTQGMDIHMGSGQEKHLAHEAWHVVQQKQGRVKPTLQTKDMVMNDDQGLEREASAMGERASQISAEHRQKKEVNKVGSVETPSSPTPSLESGLPKQAVEMRGTLPMAIIQRQGGYIPDVDGPYGFDYADGPSTAGAAFTPQMKRDIYALNALRVPPEDTQLVQISDEDDETMLTRERSVIAEVDHIYPRSLGGSSSHRNAAILSAESNNFNSNDYPKEIDNEYDGTRVLMGYAVNAHGNIRGHHYQFHVPAYEEYPVIGHGNAALIDMSDYHYNVSQNGAPSVNIQGLNNLAPAEARTLGILPDWIPDPQ